ncbi:MAG: hypothetical protein Q8P18_24845 [Pseudomonadota bacterium]|nr:hypothetical protein [Pseudomonadota bacterium]
MSDNSVLAALRSQLGTIPDQKIADQAGVSRTLVVNYRKKLGIPAYQGHKGTTPAAQAVVAPLDSRPFRGRRSALDPFLRHLGTVPDAEIARLAGVTTENVRTYRQRRLITPVWHSGASPAPATVAPPGAAAPLRTARAPRRGALEAAAAGAPPSPDPVAAAARPAGTAPRRPVIVGSSANAATAFLVLVDTDQGPRSYALLATDIAAAAAEAATRVPARHPHATIRAIQRVAELLPS